jgi:CRP-like cAMP-binding protein
MPLVPDVAAFQKKLAGLSVLKFQAGENVLTAGTATGRLLVLKSGAVEVIKDGVQIAKVASPGAVFGELAVLLDQAHTADVRALQQSEFHVADAATLLAYDPAVALYVASMLAQRLDTANRALIEVKHQLRAGERRSVIGRTVEKVELLLSSSGDVSLMYAGYPSDPYASDQSTSSL